ncbi:hypothetical protein BC829DRAFT_181204 [Chytridium lagenaria]|nr:hypothetical protein BC829DRAFT_181204 [Chytridium lagenaria]
MGLPEVRSSLISLLNTRLREDLSSRTSPLTCSVNGSVVERHTEHGSKGSVVADKPAEHGSARGSVVADKLADHGSTRGSVVVISLLNTLCERIGCRRKPADHGSARGSVVANKPAEHASSRGSVVAEKATEQGSGRGSVVAGEGTSAIVDKPLEHTSLEDQSQLRMFLNRIP